MNDFYKLVYRWDETELFYKKLYEKKTKGGEEYQEFLNSLDRKVLKENYVTVPDISSFDEFDESSPIFTTVTDIAAMKHARYTPGYMHTHTYFEMIYVVEGSLKNEVEGYGSFNMYSGDFCIMPDGTYHSVETMDDNTIVINISLKKSTFQTLFFDIISGDNILSNFFQQALNGVHNYSYLLFKTGNDEKIRECVEKIYLEYYNHRKYYNSILYNYVMVLFALLLRNYEKYFSAAEYRQSELDLVKYLRKNFSTVSLESAAKHFGYNSEYLSRLIKNTTGENFSTLMTNYKLEAAGRLLKESSLKVTQICEVIGYNSPEHFNRQFKKKYNCTPSEFRQKYQMSN